MLMCSFHSFRASRMFLLGMTLLVVAWVLDLPKGDKRMWSGTITSGGDWRGDVSMGIPWRKYESHGVEPAGMFLP